MTYSNKDVLYDYFYEAKFNEKDNGQTFMLHECPGGTGELIRALKEDKVDIVMLVFFLGSFVSDYIIIHSER